MYSLIPSRKKRYLSAVILGSTEGKPVCWETFLISLFRLGVIVCVLWGWAIGDPSHTSLDFSVGFLVPKTLTPFQPFFLLNLSVSILGIISDVLYLLIFLWHMVFSFQYQESLKLIHAYCVIQLRITWVYHLGICCGLEARTDGDPILTTCDNLVDTSCSLCQRLGRKDEIQDSTSEMC